MNRSKLVASVLVLVLSGLPVQVASAMARDTDAPKITHVKVLQAPSNQPVVIRARFEDRSELFAPSVYYREFGGGEYTSIPMTKGEEGWEAIIPAADVSGGLEYFIEVFDEQGNGPAREGEPERPIPIAVYDEKTPPTPPIGLLPPPPPPPPPPKLVVGVPPDGDDDDGIETKWWFWTAIGVAVTGGIVAGVLLTRSSGPVDQVSVQVVGPDPTVGL